MNHLLDLAVDRLRSGNVLIYPTETMYALGCLATQHEAARTVCTLKGRPAIKPLPLIVADWDMARAFLELQPEEARLARLFWPGPLSLVLRTGSAISSLCRDGLGLSAVRMSPHPVARELCARAGAPLVSSSANQSGQEAVCDPALLDPELVRCVQVAPDVGPRPAGGLPSTLVRVLGRSVRVLRHGAVSAETIRMYGFEVCSDQENEEV